VLSAVSPRDEEVSVGAIDSFMTRRNLSMLVNTDKKSALPSILGYEVL
jgi:hypothetical protein